MSWRDKHSGEIQLSNSFQRKSFTPLETAQSNNSEDEIDTDFGLLPVIRSRNAKWWYSTFHNVTAMVGAGVLGLPTTMVYLGWGAGSVLLLMSWCVTLYTLWQMVEMHEMAEVPGKRFDRYHELGQEAFGKKLGLWIVVPQQLIVEVGSNIVYMVTGGESLWRAYQLLACPKLSAGDQLSHCCKGIGKASFIVIFAAPQFFLAQLEDFNAIASISLAASVMSICYCTIAWADSIKQGSTNHSESVPNTSDYHLPDTKHADLVFGAMNALGTIAFAYAGHNVVLEIQATLPSVPKKPSKILMWRGVVVAYLIIAFCYFPVAFAGYWAFGNSLQMKSERGNPGSGNILLQLSRPRWLLVTANLMVVVHVTGSYQLYAMPVFDMLESVLVKVFHFRPTLAHSTSIQRIVTRSSYVFLTAFLACTFPFFHDLLGFLGGFAFTPTTYFLPCIIWLKVKRPAVYSISWFFNWFLIFTGFLLAALATIGGMRNIIVDSSNFHYYQFSCGTSSNHTF